MNQIQPPSGFFGSSINQASLPKDEIKNPKFSFGKLAISKHQVSNPTENTSLIIHKHENSLYLEDEISYDKKKRLKVQYIYGSNKLPRFDEKTRKIIDWSDMISQREVQKQIEERNAIMDVKSLFQGNLKPVVIEVKDDKVVVLKIKQVLSVLENNVSSKKNTSNVKGSISVDTFIDNLVNVLNFVNPEERGRILHICIFGCLISRAKLNGAGGKPAISRFPGLINAFKGYKTGGSSSANSKVYLQIREILTSSRLANYRNELTASEQVTKVTELISKTVLCKNEIYFPTETFSDPIPVIIGESKTIDLKTVGLVGLPTLENMKSFFAIVAVKPKNVNTKTKLDNDYIDSNLDVEDDLTNRLHQRSGGW